MTPFPPAVPTERSGLQAAETATAKSLTGKAYLSNEKKTIMAQIGDILEKEQKRETERADKTIHLYQEGNFYRAYEWSAWLCVKHVNPQMKVTRKPLKGSSGTFCFVGFPVSSLSKYTPDGGTVSPAGEKEMD